LTAATVVSVAYCFSAFSWYRTRDLHYQHANKLVVFNCTKPIALRILYMTDNTLLADVLECDCDIGQHHYQACNTTDKNDVWWPSVRSCRSTGKKVFTTD